MSKRVPHQVRRPQAQQAYGQAQFDAAVEPAAEHAARLGPRHDARARPELNRQERVIFTVYVVLGILIALFLAVTGVLWLLGG
jgi:hypothetical protein